jgi:hypothetical protein
MTQSPTARTMAPLVAAAFFCVGAATAEASPLSYDYTFDPPDVLINNNGSVCTGDTAANTVSSTDCKSLEFTYTLQGYDASTDALAGGTLSLTFYDDNTPGPDQTGNHDETVNIALDGVLTSNSPLLITNGSTSGSPFSASFNVLAELQNGALTIILSLPAGSEGNNDFYFATSRLTARGERDDSIQAPEPTSMLLFGTAAMGWIASSRRRRRG